MNPIIAGAATGFILAIRSGLTNAVKNGLIGGAILALIEGAAFAMQKYQMKMMIKQRDDMVA